MIFHFIFENKNQYFSRLVPASYNLPSSVSILAFININWRTVLLKSADELIESIQIKILGMELI